MPDAPRSDLVADREALARAVAPKLAPFVREGAASLQRLSAEDRRLVEPALLEEGVRRLAVALREVRRRGRVGATGALS